MRKLPSINLLVTFDSAARHLSFKKAAEELFVTPSAVGHQIRVLEKELKTPLFERLNRSINLTQEGLDYHQIISVALNTLKTATSQLIERNNKTSLLIHSIPYITNTLLVPHIKSFKALYPEMKIGIESKVERAKLMPSQLQIAIRHGKSDDNNLHYEELTAVHISPVCAPDYLEQTKQKEQSLIQLSTDKRSWQKWQSDWNTNIEPTETLHCDGFQAVIEMTEQGLGLAMGYFPILAPQVAKGRLLLPYPNKVSQLDSLYLAFTKEDKDDPIVIAFVSWFKNIITHYQF